jgi:hypothetical protein
MKIRLNSKNSKVISDKVFITTEKAYSLKEGLKSKLNWQSNINHPILGKLIEYNGEYSRSK